MSLEQLLGSAGKHHISTSTPRLGPDVDHIVGFEHHVTVVLHHHDGVALVAQLLERIDESLIIALMQPNARLIEDVEHIDQLRANLRGEPDALTLSSRQRSTGSVE